MLAGGSHRERRPTGTLASRKSFVAMAKEAAAAKKAMKVVVRIMYDEEKSVMDVNVVVMMF